MEILEILFYLKKCKKKTIFVIEASSYQLEYSKIFSLKICYNFKYITRSFERHGNIKRYINAKFKLLKNQLKGHLLLLIKDDLLIIKKLKSKKFKNKIIKVNTKLKKCFLKNINNDYFLTETNQENLSFVLEISKRLKLKNNLLFKTIQNFKGLKLSSTNYF